MSKVKLRRTIAVGQEWVHKGENLVCEVVAIWINCGGLAVIESMALDDNAETCNDSVESFLDKYRFKG